MGHAAGFRRIVVPLDGSAAAEQAVRHAVGLAIRFRLPIHLVRTVDLPDLAPAPGLEPVAREWAAAMAEEYLARVGAQLAANGLTVTTEVRRGGAAHQLLAATRAGDVLVIAGGGHRGCDGSLGRVADGIVGRALVPIIVVPTEDG